MNALDRIVDALRAHGCDPRQNGDGWSSKCPAHDDRVASLTVSEGSDGRVLVKCHAGGGCSFTEIASALDLPESAFFPPKQKKGRSMNIVETYDYVDEDYRLLYQVCRLDPKDFRQRRPDGNGGWFWRLNDTRRVPYRLPEVLAAVAAGRWIVIVEGERDVHTLEGFGIVATTNAQGAGKWPAQFATYLRGARVAVIPDMDEEGRRHRDKVTASLKGIASRVVVVAVPGGHKDITKWIDTQDDREQAGAEIKRTITGSEPWEPATGGSDADMPDLELNEEEAKAVDDLLNKIKALDEGDQKDALKALTKLLGKETQGTRLIKLALDAGVELWRDPEGTGYATIPVDDHVEHWPVRSSLFRLWLRRRFYEDEETAANANAVRDAVEALDGKALFAGNEHEVYVRVAECNGAVYVDLCDDGWRCVEITANGWTVRNGAPVRFKRRAGMLALPVPEAGGDIIQLRAFINVSDAEWPIALGWVVGAFHPRGPYPVLNVTAEHGNAKTTLCRVLRRIIDPNKSDVRAAPKETHDLMIAAGNGWVCGFDNLSSLWPRLSDDLARLSTGAGFSTRKLNENDEEQLFDACRPVIVNGIEDVVTRPDLLDRSVILHPPRIADDVRLDEETFWSDFEAARPRILGALLDGVACALSRISDIQLDSKPRMADFSKWVVAAEPALGLDEREFLAAYQANRRQGQALALEADDVAAAIRGFVEGRAAAGRDRPGNWQSRSSRNTHVRAGRRRRGQWPALSNGRPPCCAPMASTLNSKNAPRAGRRWMLTARGSESTDTTDTPSHQASDQGAPSEPSAATDTPRTSTDTPTAVPTDTWDTASDNGGDGPDGRDGPLPTSASRLLRDPDDPDGPRRFTR